MRWVSALESYPGPSQAIKETLMAWYHWYQYQTVSASYTLGYMTPPLSVPPTGASFDREVWYEQFRTPQSNIFPMVPTPDGPRFVPLRVYEAPLPPFSAPHRHLLRRKLTRRVIPVSGHPSAPHGTLKHWSPLRSLKRPPLSALIV